MSATNQGKPNQPKHNIYPELAKRWLRGGGVWLYSDPHWADPDSKFFRGDGYPGDEAQVERINSKLGKNDTIVLLGDIGDVEFVKQLRGYKVLLLGNHDGGPTDYERITYDELQCPNCRSVKLGTIWREIDGGKHHVEHHVCRDCGWEESAGVRVKTYTYDNHLFDEVYKGPLFVNDRLVLSHEAIYPLPPYLFNIHGHTHGSPLRPDDQHYCVCAETIDYMPVNLLELLKGGLLKDTPSIHRYTIDHAILFREWLSKNGRDGSYSQENIALFKKWLAERDLKGGEE